MDRITKFVISNTIAKIILTCLTIVMVTAVTLEMSNNNRISNTYASQMRAAEWKNITKENTNDYAANLSLVILQEMYRLSGRITFDTEITERINSSEHKIPCAWSDISISLSDFNLICTTVYCEAGNQTIETQIMVALTILNRLSNELYPDTVKEVLYQEEQYSVTQWTDFEKYGWTYSVEQAVTYALEVNEYPKDMFFFRTEYYHNFGKPYMVSDDLYFSTLN